MFTKQWFVGLVVLLLLGFSSELVADKFAKVIGGDTLDQRIEHIQQTSDDGYIVTGYDVRSGANTDALIFKLDSLGMIQWLEKYGTSMVETPLTGSQTTDGGCIIAGDHWLMGWGYEGLLIKFSSNGGIQWAKSFGISDSSYFYDYATRVQQTSDNGYIVAGFTGFFGLRDSTWVAKFNSQGNLIWAKSLGNLLAASASHFTAHETQDDGFVIGGHTGIYGAGGNDLFVIKLNSTGDIQWAKTYGDTSSEVFSNIQQTSDGGYIVAGWTLSYGAGDQDFLILKLSSTGDVQWAKTYGGTGIDSPSDVRKTSDGGYIVVGTTTSFGNHFDVLLIKISSTGDLEWSRTHDALYDDWSDCIALTSDGGFVIGGHTRAGTSGLYDLLVIKLESDGVYEDCFYDCSPTVTSCSPLISSAPVNSANKPMYFRSLSLNETSVTYSVDDVCPPDTGAVVRGNVGRDIPRSIYLDIIPSVGKNNFSIKYGIPKSMDISNKPTVSLKLYDATGRLERVLFEKNIQCWCQAGSYTRSLALHDISPGVYFLRLEVGNKYSVKKAILLR